MYMTTIEQQIKEAWPSESTGRSITKIISRLKELENQIKERKLSKAVLNIDLIICWLVAQKKLKGDKKGAKKKWLSGNTILG